jgi:hypothetical protein
VDYFSIHFDQKCEAKRENGMFQPTWHCCMCCNPANGRVDFEDGCYIKSSLITKDEHEVCQLTRTKTKKTFLEMIEDNGE